MFHGIENVFCVRHCRIDQRKMSVTAAPQKDHYIRTHEPVYRFQYWTSSPNTIIADPNNLQIIRGGKTEVTLSFGANATLDATRTWMMALEAFTCTFDLTKNTPNEGIVLRVSGIGSRGTKTNFQSVTWNTSTGDKTNYHDGCSAYFPIFTSKNTSGSTINLLTNAFTNKNIGERVTNMNFLNSTVQFEVLSAPNMIPFDNIMTFSLSMVVYEYKSD
jgi:hypothetical protein